MTGEDHVDGHYDGMVVTMLDGDHDDNDDNRVNGESQHRRPP